jgi:hypothetical protein
MAFAPASLRFSLSAFAATIAQGKNTVLSPPCPLAADKSNGR